MEQTNVSHTLNETKNIIYHAHASTRAWCSHDGKIYP